MNIIMDALPYYFLLSQRGSYKEISRFGKIKLTGKFLVKIKGAEMF